MNQYLDNVDVEESAAGQIGTGQTGTGQTGTGKAGMAGQAGIEGQKGGGWAVWQWIDSTTDLARRYSAIVVSSFCPCQYMV